MHVMQNKASCPREGDYANLIWSIAYQIVAQPRTLAGDWSKP